MKKVLSVFRSPIVIGVVYGALWNHASLESSNKKA